MNAEPLERQEAPPDQAWVMARATEALSLSATTGIWHVCDQARRCGLARSTEALWWRGPLAQRGRQVAPKLRRALDGEQPLFLSRRLFVPLRWRGQVAGALMVSSPRSGSEGTFSALALLVEAILPRVEREELDLAARKALLACRRHLPSDADLAYVRHELKSPLVPMKGYADMMRKGMAGEVTPKMASYLERIGDAVTRQRSLIDRHLRPAQPSVDLRRMLASALFEVAEGPPAWVVAEAESLAFLVRCLARGTGVGTALCLERTEGGWVLKGPALRPGRARTLSGAAARRCGATLTSTPSHFNLTLPGHEKLERASSAC